MFLLKLLVHVHLKNIFVDGFFFFVSMTQCLPRRENFPIKLISLQAPNLLFSPSSLCSTEIFTEGCISVRMFVNNLDGNCVFLFFEQQQYTQHNVDLLLL